MAEYFDQRDQQNKKILFNVPLYVYIDEATMRKLEVVTNKRKGLFSSKGQFVRSAINNKLREYYEHD